MFTQKLKETLEECDFRWKRNSAKTSSLVLPSNLELKLKYTEGDEYIVSNVEYDFVESAFKVYSKDANAQFQISGNVKMAHNEYEADATTDATDDTLSSLAPPPK